MLSTHRRLAYRTSFLPSLLAFTIVSHNLLHGPALEHWHDKAVEIFSVEYATAFVRPGEVDEVQKLPTVVNYAWMLRSTGEAARTWPETNLLHSQSLLVNLSKQLLIKTPAAEQLWETWHKVVWSALEQLCIPCAHYDNAVELKCQGVFEALRELADRAEQGRKRGSPGSGLRPQSSPSPPSVPVSSPSPSPPLFPSTPSQPPIQFHPLPRQTPAPAQSGTLRPKVLYSYDPTLSDGWNEGDEDWAAFAGRR
ncbi:hypothetical protein JCM8547_000258 [Rhodosporidiobolus lusitaniae]